jgi:hypothetical protein
VEQVTDSGRLYDHLGDRVGDDVMQFVRDPRALFYRCALLGSGNLLTQLASPRRAGAPGHGSGSPQPAEEGMHGLTVTIKTHRRVIPAYEQKVIPADDAAPSRAVS